MWGIIVVFSCFLTSHKDGQGEFQKHGYYVRVKHGCSLIQLRFEPHIAFTPPQEMFPLHHSGPCC